MSEEMYTSELRHSWDPHKPSTVDDLRRSTHNAPFKSMPSTSLVPYSRYNPQFPQQDSLNEQGQQLYQQPKSQSRSTKVNQPNANAGKDTSALKSCKSLVSSELVVGLLIGAVLFGVPMAVITSLYVKALASSNSSGSSSGSSGSASNTSLSTSLPSQCSSYTSLSDPYRVYTYTSCCYTPDCSLTAAWYRITGSSGSQLVTTPISTGYCGSSYPSWFNGSFPTVSGVTITGVVCVNVGGTICPSSYSTTISVTNCNGFYVFYLIPFPICSVRYCTM